MASFLNHFRYRDDVEFRDLESGERSDTNIYPSLPPTYPTHASMQIVQLSPADVKMQSDLDPNVKRSNYWNQADPTKVRIVPQTSRIPTVREISKRYEVKLQRSNQDFAGKAEEYGKELKQLLDAAEQRTSEEKALRAKEKRFYEEEMVRVREEGKRRVEEVSKIAQQVKEEASRQAEERRGHVEEIKRVRDEGSHRVERVSKMAEEIHRQQKEEATRRAEERRIHHEEIEKIKKEAHRREEEIFKRAEDATKKAQEAIAAALAGKEAAERQSANLMEEAGEKIRKAVEEAMVRVEQRKGNPRTERQESVIRNSEMLDSDADVEAVQELVQIPTAGPSNLAKRHLRVEQKVTFSDFQGFFSANYSIKDSIKEN
jgi:hypothetical protein